MKNLGTTPSQFQTWLEVEVTLTKTKLSFKYGKELTDEQGLQNSISTHFNSVKNV